MGRSAAASLLHAAAFGLRTPLAGDQVAGVDLAVALRTIFAQQSLVSTLLMKWPTGGSQFGFILIWHFARTGKTYGIRNHASKEAR